MSVDGSEKKEKLLRGQPIEPPSLALKKKKKRNKHKKFEKKGNKKRGSSIRKGIEGGQGRNTGNASGHFEKKKQGIRKGQQTIKGGNKGGWGVGV